VNQTQKVTAKPNYGVDAPDIMRNFLLFGGIAIAAGLLLLAFNPVGIILTVAGVALCAVGLVNLTLGCIMVGYALRGKFIYRDYVLNLINWRGDEMVLDVIHST